MSFTRLAPHFPSVRSNLAQIVEPANCPLEALGRCPKRPTAPHHKHFVCVVSARWECSRARGRAARNLVCKVIALEYE